MEKKFTSSSFFTFLKTTALLLCIFTGLTSIAQPANDLCTNAQLIPIGNNGFATGVFTSDTIDISAATMQSGETVPTAIFVAGQYYKSVWFRFSISTSRRLKVTLGQPSINIAAGSVGFTVYKTNNCLPGAATVSTKLTPLETFGSSFHPCVDSGNYLIQVSSKATANGSIFVKLEIDPTQAAYDNAANAYSFGILNTARKAETYEIGCHSVEPGEAFCSSIAGAAQYQKTSWHTFTTPSYFDYISFLIAAGNSTYFTNATQHIIGYKLYEGDAQTTPLQSLALIGSCDTLRTNGLIPGYRTYRCGDLDTGKTYSLQLFFKNDFNASIKVGFFKEGVQAAKGPLPILSWMNVDNIMGNLPMGTTNRTDYFACSSRHLTNACGNTKQTNGILKYGVRYNLSTYYTFTLSQFANVTFSTSSIPGVIDCKTRYLRLYSNGISNNCTSLDTTSLYQDFYNDTILKCLPAGDYTLQVMGSEDFINPFNSSLVTNSNTSACMYGNFGQAFNLAITLSPVLQSNHFALQQANAFDAVNNMNPLVAGSNYLSTSDTFGCHDAALPVPSNLPANYKKAMYRQFVLTDSAIVNFGTLNTSFLLNNSLHYYRYQLYRNSANAQVIAQNTWAYPDTFTGLIPYTNALQSVAFNNMCLEPDTYTLVTYGTQYFVDRTDRPTVMVSQYTTQHFSPATAENMGSIIDTINNPLGGSVSSGIDYFSCRNNAVTIDGLAPCGGATKAIYREFYLSQPAQVNIGGASASGGMALFSGRISTVGYAGLSNVSGCGYGYTPPNCGTLPAGWYTVVSYSGGSSYTNPTQNGNPTVGAGVASSVMISVQPACTAPQFNRPHKAAINTTTNSPFLIEWDASVVNTAYPNTAAEYTLPTEFWNCATDTPFSSHPITACNMGNKVAYYVFELTQESYLHITNSGSHAMKLYKRDIRTDSLLFDTLSPVHSCNFSKMEICKAQPGVYTLAVFGSGQCVSFSPHIYIDRASVSRFDHARNAYDFGAVPATNTYYNGKVGNINPLHPGRAPSNDFFYCTTGAHTTDPTNSSCQVTVNPAIYATPDTNNVLSAILYARRNLWYTFQLSTPGTVKVKVENKTVGKMQQLPFAVFRSDVNGALPFDQVVNNGQVDSTILQGLTFVAYNGPYPLPGCQGSAEVTFTIPHCNFDTQRYYIVVDNRYSAMPAETMKPNHQAEVSVLIDPAPPMFTNYDYYATASDMGTIGIGTFTGNTDNYTCATANPSYPGIMPFCLQRKTIWYKFTVDTGIVGTARMKLRINNTTDLFGAADFVLYREIAPNDSTNTGLEQQVLSDGTNYRQACVYTGTYYLVASGCNRTTEDVFPQVQILQDAGDYCAAPLVANVNGPGAYSATVQIDCHTIGTDYGELGTSLTCPPNGLTAHYKSSWFRIDVGGTDTLDVNISLTENTNATSSQIHYRMMTGDCNAMQEQSCVLDAATQNTYQCLVPGTSYYLQVLTSKSFLNNDPEFPTLGSITLHVNAVQHIDTCAPMINCLVNANYIPDFNCNTNDSVIFNNFSTFGSAIEYLWDFGYNNETATEFEPRFLYPALNTAATYTVTLRAVNTGCLDTSYSTQTITIPARPLINLGNDTFTCVAGTSFILDATSYPGSTYMWQDASTNPVFAANTPGWNTYHVAVTYNGCSDLDSITIYISPLVAAPVDTLLICDNQTAVTLDASRPYTSTTYTWYDFSNLPVLNVNTPGAYWADVSLEGCIVRDSFVIDFNIDTLSVLGNDTAICNFVAGYMLNGFHPDATAYQWQDASTQPQLTINAPGTYWVMATIDGCAYSDTVIISSLPLPEAIVYDTICHNGVYNLPLGGSATTSGLYRDTIATIAGCDSVFSVYLTVRDSVYAAVWDTVCSNNMPYVWNGINVNSGGQAAAAIVQPDQYGCDSTTVLHLWVEPIDTTQLQLSLCNLALPYNFFGNYISAAGTYYHTLSNQLDCDSTIVLQLNIVSEYRDTITNVICAADSVVFYDSVYYNSGYYTHNFPSSAGCDSFKVLALEIFPAVAPPTVASPVAYCLNEAAAPLSASGSNLLWYNSAIGGTGSTTAPTPLTGSAGQQVYYVSQTINNCEGPRDSIVVFVSEKSTADFILEPDFAICTNDSATATFTGVLIAGGTLVWDWDGGSVTGNDPGPYRINWPDAGMKTVRLWINNDGCMSDTVTRFIEIKPTPEDPVLDIPDYVCINDSVTIAHSLNGTGIPYWMYDGQPYHAGHSFRMSWPSPGMHHFSLHLEDMGCSSGHATDSIKVAGLPLAKISGLNGLKICLGDTLQLSTPNPQGTYAFQWEPPDFFPNGIPDNTEAVAALIDKGGWILVEVTSEYGCRSGDSILVYAEHCCDLNIPNAFSPNGDGINDDFRLYPLFPVVVKEFSIYNRFGQRVFLTQNSDMGWDGYQNGNPSDPGTYHFYVKYVCADGNTYVKKGNLHLIR